VFAAAVLAAAGAAVADPAADLLEADRAFARVSAERGVADAFAQFLAEDALSLPDGGVPQRGREAIVDELRAGPAFELEWTPREAEVAASGELGWTWGVYTVRVPKAEGGVRTRSGKYLNVWRRKPGGDWRVIVDMGNQDPQTP
jgi:ketosteroid isomerase-like protein